MSEKSIDETASAAGITDNEQRLAILRRQNELIADDEKRKAEQDQQTADKEKQKEEKERQQLIEAKMATGLGRDDAEKAVNSDLAQQKAAADKAREEKEKAKEQKQQQQQQREVEKLTEDVEKEDDGKGDEKELAELGALVEGLLAMTQPSAVEDEREAVAGAAQQDGLRREEAARDRGGEESQATATQDGRRTRRGASHSVCE